MPDSAPRALEPYRVLDLTEALGALCGRVLAGLGADVIKVERPGGDPSRALGPFLGEEPHPHRSLSWIYANAGKRGATLDLGGAAGRALLRRLVAVSDFLIESFPPGHLESLGLGYEDLAAVNPALVMVRISPFGQTGPYRHYQGTDLIAWALGGAMHLDGDADRPPVRVTAPQTWLLAGAHAAAGAMTAHYARRRTGLGQQVDISAQECATWTLMIAAQMWDVNRINQARGGGIRRNTRADGSVLEHRTLWPCKDGFVAWNMGGGAQTGALSSTRALVAWMVEEGMGGDAAKVDWSTNSAATMNQETYDRLSVPFLAFFATHTKRELFEGAIARSIQLAAVNEMEDIANSPQFAAREYWTDIEHPYLNAALRFPGAPVKLSATPWRLDSPAPLPGEHNVEVYGGLLGLCRPQIEELRDKGVV
jgi:crotonobetainyl-CoA:carnitine CoA-transferase CaiB-like acyl-CoA transferase